MGPTPNTELCSDCGRQLPTAALDASELVCSCGLVHAKLFSTDEECRVFSDEPESQGRRRAEAYLREDVVPVSVPGAPEKWRRWAEGRVSQSTMLLSHLHSEEPGAAFLTRDEVSAALSDVRAAAEKFALEQAASGAAHLGEVHGASALFWSICTAQNVAARRSGGWVVGSVVAAEAWSMDTLHDYLAAFQSESHIAAERLGNATCVGGGGVARAAALVNDVKRRQLRIDSLGSFEARGHKLRALDRLLRAAHRPGLERAVLEQSLPRVRAPPECVGRARGRLSSRAAQWEARVARRSIGLSGGSRGRRSESAQVCGAWTRARAGPLTRATYQGHLPGRLTRATRCMRLTLVRAVR